MCAMSVWVNVCAVRIVFERRWWWLCLIWIIDSDLEGLRWQRGFECWMSFGFMTVGFLQSFNSGGESVVGLNGFGFCCGFLLMWWIGSMVKRHWTMVSGYGWFRLFECITEPITRITKSGSGLRTVMAVVMIFVWCWRCMVGWWKGGFVARRTTIYIVRRWAKGRENLITLIPCKIS